MFSVLWDLHLAPKLEFVKVDCGWSGSHRKEPARASSRNFAVFSAFLLNRYSSSDPFSQNFAALDTTESTSEKYRIEIGVR